MNVWLTECKFTDRSVQFTDEVEEALGLDKGLEALVVQEEVRDDHGKVSLQETK